MLSYDNSDDHQLYGRVITSVREIGMGRTKLPVVNKRGSCMGHLFVENFTVDMKPSLKSYMRGGWKLNCTIAIDFTMSNLPIKNYRSKHRQDPKREGDMNPYERAIYEVSNALQSFSHRGRFTMYGFGGVPRYLKDADKLTREEEEKLVRCWNLLGEPKADESSFQSGFELKVEGKMGALGAYHRAAKATTFAGPTYFAGILRRFMKAVKYGMANC